MKKHYCKFIFISISMIILILSCKKDDPSEKLKQQEQLTTQEFLTLPVNVSKDLIRIAAELGKQNDKENFIPKLVKHYGNVEWNFVKNQKNQKLHYYLPLVNNNQKKVKAIIRCTVEGNKVQFTLINKKAVNKIVNASDNKPLKRVTIPSHI